MDSKKLWRIGIGLLALALAAGLLYVLRNALVPVSVAVFLAYLLDPVIDRLEARKIPRSAAIFILAGVLFVVAGVVGGFLAVQAQREMVALYHDLPKYLETAQGSLGPKAKEYLGIELPATLQQAIAEAKAQLANIDPAALKPVSNLVGKITRSTLAFVSWILGLVIIPVFLFYFLRDWDRLKYDVLEYVPLSHRDYVSSKARQIDEILGAFIRGQLTICVILGVLYSAGLMLTGIDLAVVIGFSAGILFIVPYLGTILGIIAASIMALLKFGISWQLIGVWAAFGVAQLLEGTLITPRVMGDRVGLSPVIVIFALLVGADLLGILGMLIAVPCAAVIKVFVREGLDKYRASSFFQEKDSPEKDSPEKDQAGPA
ncbi:MAG TPA: AI-2E family transporter [bacterium]|nr:AI-2E family transporter [bacterium]